eukprot:11036336-Karenia_brevis.AAC.1
MQTDIQDILMRNADGQCKSTFLDEVVDSHALQQYLEIGASLTAEDEASIKSYLSRLSSEGIAENQEGL